MVKYIINGVLYDTRKWENKYNKQMEAKSEDEYFVHGIARKGGKYYYEEKEGESDQDDGFYVTSGYDPMELEAQSKWDDDCQEKQMKSEKEYLKDGPKPEVIKARKHGKYYYEETGYDPMESETESKSDDSCQEKQIISEKEYLTNGPKREAAYIRELEAEVRQLRELNRKLQMNRMNPNQQPSLMLQSQPVSPFGQNQRAYSATTAQFGYGCQHPYPSSSQTAPLYVDSAVTSHITSDLNSLSLYQPYQPV